MTYGLDQVSSFVTTSAIVLDVENGTCAISDSYCEEIYLGLTLPLFIALCQMSTLTNFFFFD